MSLKSFFLAASIVGSGVGLIYGGMNLNEFLQRENAISKALADAGLTHSDRRLMRSIFTEKNPDCDGLSERLVAKCETIKSHLNNSNP